MWGFARAEGGGGHEGLLPAGKQLLDLWRREQQEPFEGWDFSYLAGRYFEGEPPWYYDALARLALTSATSSVLDMGTGGGEKLLELVDALPADTVATGLDVERSDDWSRQAVLAEVGAPLLLRLHESGPARGGPISFTIRRFYLQARKPIDVHHREE